MTRNRVKGDCPIGCLLLPPQVINALKQCCGDTDIAPPETVNDLLSLYQARRLREIRKIGVVSVEVIRERLAVAGFSLDEGDHDHKHSYSHDH